MEWGHWKPAEALSLAVWLPDSYRKNLPAADGEVLRLVETWLGRLQPNDLLSLRTPFSALSVPAIEKQPACVSPPPTYWSSDPDGFPTVAQSDAARAFQQWEQAVERLSVPETLPFARHYGALVGLAQTYLHTVAANEADVPQTLQRQLVGAHAAALWRAREQEEPDAGFALLVADLSGIQNYLFGTAAFGVGGVARSLRARSFYLTQIATLFAWSLLDRLGLPPANLLLDTGGKVYLLFAPTRSALAEIEAAKQAAEAWGFQAMHGELTLNIASTHYRAEDLQEGRFGTIWQNAGRAVAQEKQRRLGSALQSAGNWQTQRFLIPDAFDHQEPCLACKRFARLRDKDRCAACRRDEDLGKLLPHVDWIAYERVAPADVRPEEIAAFGWRVRMGNSSAKPPDTAAWVVALDPNFALRSTPLPVRSLARYVPTKADRAPMTFEEIAAQAQGRPCLAYLKADVDRLGERFVFGLRDEQGRSSATLPRLAHLSRALETFFGVELERLVRQEFPACYIVFSGGDDLTLIGPYDQVLRLAGRLAQDFHRFLGYPDGLPQPTDVLTLSAGVALVTPRVPVSTVIPRADNALHIAKAAGRNSIHLLGRTLPWTAYDRLLSRLWDAGGKPAPGLGQEMLQGVPSSFLYHLLQYAIMWEGYRTGKREGLRYQPLLAYEIGRNVDRNKTPTVYDWATWLARISLDDGGNWQAAMDDLGMFTRLVLLYRTGGGERSGRTA